jgi:predicted Zn-dependent protease with MMP-like domain
MADLAEIINAGWQAYGQGDLDAALAQVRLGLTESRDHGGLWFLLGCALERGERLREADRAFTRAAKASQERRPLPYRIGWSHFARLVQDACDSLDDEDRQALEELDLVLADHPEAGIIEPGTDPEPIGFFAGHRRGVVRGERGRLHLYRRALEHRCGSHNELGGLLAQALAAQTRVYRGVFGDDSDSDTTPG